MNNWEKLEQNKKEELEKIAKERDKEPSVYDVDAEKENKKIRQVKDKELQDKIDKMAKEEVEKQDMEEFEAKIKKKRASSKEDWKGNVSEPEEKPGYQVIKTTEGGKPAFTIERNRQ